MISFSRLNKHPLISENIYNWVNTDSPDVECKKVLYKSKYSLSVKHFYDTVKSPIPRTMGNEKTPLRSPHDFLKKHSGQRKFKSESKIIPCHRGEFKERPSSEDVREIKLTRSVPRCSNRNFLKENTVLARRTPATAPKPKIVDDRRGHSFKLDKSGWVPKYSFKENYGQKPKYIEFFDKNRKKAKEAFMKILLTGNHFEKPIEISEERKEEIFEGVVRNWKELLKRYLMLPLQTDTASQKRRKLEIEKKIQSLEEDIELLTRNKDLFLGRNILI